MANLKNHLCFLPIVLGLVIVMGLPNTSWAQRRERYKSYDRDRGSNMEEYSHKNRDERKSFDRNFGRYQSLSPRQKRQKLEKWREFKHNTTPEERDFILHKMREKKERRRNLDR